MSFNREKLQQKFSEEYKKLNEQQRKAVDTIEGPVMVIAGPGTGKTQILASRVGKILMETDVFPRNILCLTYTEAGVLAMRKRLLQFIGPDAYKVNIYTFHAFCNDVIQENLGLFDKNSLDIISELEKIAFYKQLIDSFPKNHPLKRFRGDVYLEINNLQELFSTMKREGWTPAFINQKIDEYINSLPDRDEFVYKRKYKEYNIGELKRDRIEEEKQKMEKLRAAVNEFDSFQQLMRQRNRYDFDDMINWLITAFEENKNLLAKYQEQFLYILVDEYQDTSGTQNRLVELLISFWNKPNVFVVGDDDQSIFRFQGANIENMMLFADSYKKDLFTIVLTDNYRSTQPILDISKTLISRNNERLINRIPQLTKELVSSHPDIRTLSHLPVIKEYDTYRHEMIDITLQVQKLVAEGIPPGNIAVIYRENKYGEELSRYFKLIGTPLFTKRFLNILQAPLVKKIVLLLNWLAAEHDVPYSGDEMLFEILHFDWFQAPPIEIARLTVEAAESRYGNQPTSLRKLLYDKSNTPPRDLFSQGLHSGLQKASAILERLIANVTNITLQQLLERIIRETGLLNAIIHYPDKHWQLQVLSTFFDFVKDETRRDPMMNLHGLMTIIQLMTSEDLSLQLVQVSGSDTSVNLLTAHGSKGLEFEYVFFAGCNANFWEKKRKTGFGYKMPETIFTSQYKHDDEEELRRLFYVALTRAEQHLYISYCRYKEDGKEIEPSMFIAEILDQHFLPLEKIFLTDETLSEFSILEFGKIEAPEIDKAEEEFINRLLEKFIMNVTALNNYLRCPLEFYFKNLIRIPSPKNDATEFGSAVHYSLEQLFRKMFSKPTLHGEQNNGNGEFLAKEIFIADFEWYMHRHRESFTSEQFDRRLEYGRDVLGNYYDNYIKSFNKIVTIEYNIRNVVVNGVPLKGKLDKLEFDGKTVNVVDYKSGDPDKGKEKLKGPSEKNPDGGDYWRQAVFYKILVDNYEQKSWKVISAEFDFIEPDRKKNYCKQKLIVTPQDITTVTQQITDTWRKIQNREFYTGCGKEDCHWCNFIKTNNLTVGIHELEEEESEL